MIWKGLVWAAVSVLCWGGLFPVGRMLMLGGDITPLSLGMSRFTLAGLLMIIIGVFTCPKQLFAPKFKDYLIMALQGALGAGLMSFLLFMAQKQVAAVNASMLEAIVPLQICVIALLSGKKFNLLQSVGLLIGFLGCLLVLKVLTFNGLQINNLQAGDGLIFLSGLCWATYTLWGRSYINRFGGYTFTAWTILFGGLALMLANLWCIDSWHWPRQTQTWYLLSYTVLFPSALAFFSWNEAQRYISTALLSLSEYFTPLLTALIALVMLNESLTFGQFIGAIIVIGAVLAEPEIGSVPNFL